jgi:hypothetical protein
MYRIPYMLLHGREQHFTEVCIRNRVASIQDVDGQHLTGNLTTASDPTYTPLQ